MHEAHSVVTFFFLREYFLFSLILVQYIDWPVDDTVEFPLSFCKKPKRNRTFCHVPSSCTFFSPKGTWTWTWTRFWFLWRTSGSGRARVLPDQVLRKKHKHTNTCVCVWLMFTQTFVSICTELHHRVSGTFLHLNRPRSFLEGSSFRLTVPVTPRDKHFNSSGNLVPVTKKKVGFHAGDRVWGPEQ